jgi:phosphohistidine phosphatase SixA
MIRLDPRIRLPWTRALLALSLAGLALGLFLASAASSSHPASSSHIDPRDPFSADPKSDTATVVLVRHAEKDPSADAKDSNPGLGEAGRRRAAALARLLSHSGVTDLIASEYRRAQETLAPLAESTGRKVEVVPASESARCTERLSRAPSGSVSVVAGHSNTIPALIEALGGRVGDVVNTAQGPQLRESEYDRIFIVTLGPLEKRADHEQRRAWSTVELRYGD